MFIRHKSTDTSQLTQNFKKKPYDSYIKKYILVFNQPINKNKNLNNFSLYSTNNDYDPRTSGVIPSTIGKYIFN